MDRASGDNFHFNTETEFVPILGLVAEQLNSKDAGSKDKSKATSIQDNHHPALLSLLADELSVAPEAIHDFELFVTASFRTLREDDNTISQTSLRRAAVSSRWIEQRICFQSPHGQPVLIVSGKMTIGFILISFKD